jgi:hypothetical protein
VVCPSFRTLFVPWLVPLFMARCAMLVRVLLRRASVFPGVLVPVLFVRTTMTLVLIAVLRARRSGCP